MNASIVFVHGISNKPPVTDLKRIWLDSLADVQEDNMGFDVSSEGVNSYFVYWADLFHETALSASEYESNIGLINEQIKDVSLPQDEWLYRMLEKFPLDENEYVFDEEVASKAPLDYERIPLPWFIKKKLLKQFLKEVHDYLFNVEGVRDEIQNRFSEIISNIPDSNKIILVGHSLGSVITYDYLSSNESCPNIDGHLTLGSPLGLDEIRDKLTWNRDNGFPAKLIGKWFNVYDSLDPVSRIDPILSNNFKDNGVNKIIDIREQNWGKWRHSATKYFKGSKLRNSLRILTSR